MSALSAFALRFATLSAGLLLGISSNAGATSINYVQNGSFESLSVSGVSAQLGSRTTSNSSSPIQNVANWTSAPDGSNLGYNFVFSGASTTDANGKFGSAYGSRYGALSLAGMANGVTNGISDSPDGGNFLALDGNFGTTAVSQLLLGLTPGLETQVSFYYAAAQQSGATGANTESLSVALADAAGGTQLRTTPALNIGSQGFSGWKYTTLDFTATSGNEVLSFLAQSGPNGAPPFVLLDGVSAIQVTPEPSSLALLGTGVLAMGGLIRRRFARQS